MPFIPESKHDRFRSKLSSSIKIYNPNKIEQTEKKGESQVAGYSTVLASTCVVKGKKKMNSNTFCCNSGTGDSKHG